MLVKRARGLSLYFIYWLILLGWASCFKSYADRSYIHVVGSASAYPFIASVAEIFSTEDHFKAPIIESTGSGGGIKVFCNGSGTEYPDMVTTSRPMTKQEILFCSQNGVQDFLQLTIGYDGIVLARSSAKGIRNLTIDELFDALAYFVIQEGVKIPNPHQTWADVSKDLPAQIIKILGPPSTSGTKQTFLQLILEHPQFQIEKPRVLPSEIRDDHAYIETAEQESIILKKLQLEKEALAIFSFGFLTQNRDDIHPLKINGIYPTFNTITSGLYPLSKPLYIYIKKQSLEGVPGLKEFITLLLSDDISGPDGYLKNFGFISLPFSLRVLEKQKALQFLLNHDIEKANGKAR
jgi:phosphate transport system substrate-binding protein